jgi:hypothetical protein
LNPAAWSDAAAGTFGTAAPYYNDNRWQRQPGESLSIGRTFRINHGDNFHGALNVRAEFQNVFNRVFYSMPSATNPQALTTCGSGGTATAGALTPCSAGSVTGGYGYVNVVNGAGTSPRSGQLVARFTF